MVDNDQLLRRVGALGLTMSGITCIIGSGWLFGAYHAAKLAGPASIFSWIIGGIAILLIALTVIELATMFPQSGGMARYMHYSHGSLTGFISGWANWLAIVTVIPAEATASIQYMASWHWPWAQALFNAATGKLNIYGVFGALLLVVFYFLLNYWTVKLLMRFIVIVTIFKIVVPVLTVLLIFSTAFHPSNFAIAIPHGFAPYGWPAILTAVATSGIVFSFNGFQTPANFAGEAKNPHKSIPIATISSILITLVLYVALQTIFIGAVSPSLLSQVGWHGLQFSSPYAQLSISLNLNLLVLLLYADAFISPSVTAVAYMGSTTRMLYGMQRNGHMPEFMGKVHPKYHIPRGALWANLVVSLIFLFIYRGWGGLAAVISVATVISYLTGPVATMGLRRVAPTMLRPVRLPLLSLLAPLTFIIITLVFFWARWPLTGQIILALSTGLLVFLYYQHKQGWENFGQHFKASIWLICYMAAIALLSYIGDSSFGGINLLPAGWDQLIVAIVALFFYYWGIRSAWATPALMKIVHMSPTALGPDLPHATIISPTIETQH